ncbi:MAG: hypothetical protein KAY37_11605 [Phycisphaerae bacterium]|nr:hypothetical protein [Phycisphaerae bacterium]
MADNGAELRKIDWSQAFPFVRLFQTLWLALDFKRMILALTCVILTCLGGCFLDAVWGQRGNVAIIADDNSSQTEIDAFATLSPKQYFKWCRRAHVARQQLAVQTLIHEGVAENEKDALTKLASSSLRVLLIDDEQRKAMEEARNLISERLAAGLEAIDNNQELSEGGKEKQRTHVTLLADLLRRPLTEDRHHALPFRSDIADVIRKFLQYDPDYPTPQRSDAQSALMATVTRQMQLFRYERLNPRGPIGGPRGPFWSLLQYESHCFAAAIQGVCAGRLGFSGSAFDAEPAMAGSICSACHGVIWLVTRHGVYALLLGVWMLLVFSFFGGALCRGAAVQSARGESVGWGALLRFAKEKYGGFLIAPLLPVIVFIVIGVFLLIGGLVGAIPYVGEILAGIFCFLALLGGIAMAVILLATVLGFHLMWPTIAVEGSDGGDGLSRAFSYLGTRFWHVGFYSLVLLVFGALSFVLVRLVTMFTLKLTHTCTKLTMNWDGNSTLDSVGKLDGIWRMPAWSDISILPSTGDVPFWGTFHTAPLDGAETIALVFIWCWVHLVVALVGAFVVSFFFCGSTQMYFLLRRDVDATDWEEVYYEEEPDKELLPTIEPASSAPAAPATPPESETPPDETPRTEQPPEEPPQE